MIKTKQSQLLTKGFLSWEPYINANKSYIWNTILIAKFKDIACLNCNYAGDFSFRAFACFSDMDLNNKEILAHFVSKKQIKSQCPKCNFINKIKIANNCQWE